MNRKQIKAYIKKEGSECPFCGSTEIWTITNPDDYEGEYETIFNNEAKREVSCSSCGRTWREYYKLHDIEQLDVDSCAIPNEDDMDYDPTIGTIEAGYHPGSLADPRD